MKYKSTFKIVNTSRYVIKVILEPWAEYHTLQPGQHIDIVGEGGEVGDNFELTYEGRYVLVHAWPNSLANAYRDGIELAPEAQTSLDEYK